MSEKYSNLDTALGRTRFKHNLEFEYVMLDFFGKGYYGIASGFEDPDFCKKCMLRVVKRIRKRMGEILSVDERLRWSTNIILERLESDAKRISAEENNDWCIIANLLDLVAHFLGYDWQDGRIHREVFFFQNKIQEQMDKRIENPRDYYDSIRSDERLRYMVVNFLRMHQLPKHQIARLLGIGLRRVDNILSNITEYEKRTGKSFPEFRK